MYKRQIPRIEYGGLLTVWGKQMAGESLTESEKETAEISGRLLEQFKDHHRIVIALPVHNFNIPSRLKDYMDNILIAREVFKYTKEGSVGLMTDDYKVLALIASGSVYTNNDRYTPLDFANYYLKEVFTEIMGFNSYDIVRAQGTARSSADENVILQEVEKEIEKILPVFYGK